MGRKSQCVQAAFTVLLHVPALFERSADAIWLFDPKAGVFVDCNAAAVTHWDFRPICGLL